LVMFFICHACLLRPLDEAGKLKLAGDMAEFEYSVAQLCPSNSVDTLPAPGSKQSGQTSKSDQGKHRFKVKPGLLLRALKQLLFVETKALVSSSIVTEAQLPPSCVMHHMLARWDETTSAAQDGARPMCLSKDIDSPHSRLGKLLVYSSEQCCLCRQLTHASLFYRTFPL